MLSPTSWKDMGLVVNGEDRHCTIVMEPFAKGKKSHINLLTCLVTL